MSENWIVMKCLYCLILNSWLSATGMSMAGSTHHKGLELHNDSLKIKGSSSVSGLIQTGNEQRIVFSLLSDISVSKHKYALEPITSIAYSSKPGKEVEGEYLGNLIVRYHPHSKFYPALGLGFEKSLLKKIESRKSIAGAVVYNILDKDRQNSKLAMGYIHEFTIYSGPFYANNELATISASRSSDQLYVRLKGSNDMIGRKLVISYDFFYQPVIRRLADYRWMLIASIDMPLSKLFALRSSAVSGYEYFVAPDVRHYNFRLTYGLSLNF